MVTSARGPINAAMAPELVIFEIGRRNCELDRAFDKSANGAGRTDRADYDGLVERLRQARVDASLHVGVVKDDLEEARGEATNKLTCTVLDVDIDTTSLGGYIVCFFFRKYPLQANMNLSLAQRTSTHCCKRERPSQEDGVLHFWMLAVPCS